ncbi:invasion associated locus B family protein [Oceanicella actignis]|uniref:invasion associated locus B family protein n=1 Tax=Oceanicella actignis TaxID=1189325 RepID=UPI0011E750E5|nr:invasion associated locus B family protein [Oceanicella actignis]TYO89899.1 invasion protein IalB [Oceanicella actignis]
MAGMRGAGRTGLRATLVALALAWAAAPPAAAQARAPNWLKSCENGRCTVAARLVADGADRIFATIVIGFDERGGAPTLTLVAPLGIAVPPGVRLVVDGERAIDAPVTVCLPDGCRAARALSEDELAALARAQTLEVRYFEAAGGRQLAAPVSTAGLSALLADAR